MNRTISIIFALFLSLALTACDGDRSTPDSRNEILSQKVTDEGKTRITVLVKYAFSINAFEQAVEKKFPQIDLVQVGNYTSDRGLVEYERRLEHDDLPDLVMTWPLQVGERFLESRLIDLSGFPFTNRYNTYMLNKIAGNDGKLYYLPGPAQVRGIVYNKTLFAEKGWKVPHDFDSFVALCKKIEASGMRSIQLGFGNGEVLDTAFVGFNFGDGFSSPADGQWLADYNKGQGSFSRHLPGLKVFHSMIDAGIWKKSDLNITYADREAMFFSRKAAMIEDSVLLTRMGHSHTGTNDEFGLMPFFSPGKDNDWARLYMVSYIGLNKHLQDAGNKDKLDVVLQLMDYISTPEGQAALAADTGAMYSSLKNVPPPDIPEIEHLRETLHFGRYAIFPELARSQTALRKGLAGMLGGNKTAHDVVKLVDQQNLMPQSVASAEIIGKATEDFTLVETGNFLTDAMRKRSGTDVALFLDNGKDGRFNGKGISARLYKGNQTMQDVVRVLPDLKEGEAGVLQVVEMSGANLLQTLEHSITVGSDGKGWFYYFSGLRMAYAPAAKPGSRIRSITTVDGTPIVPAKIYRVAVMDQTMPKDAIRTQKNMGITIREVFASAIREKQEITPSGDGRFIISKP